MVERGFLQKLVEDVEGYRPVERMFGDVRCRFLIRQSVGRSPAAFQ